MDMRNSILYIMFFLSFGSFAQSEKTCYDDQFENRICVDTTDIPKELIPWFHNGEFNWEEIPEGCEKSGLEILEIKKLKKNKKYRFRFLSSCQSRQGGATSIGGAVYIVKVKKTDRGNFIIVSKEFQYGEI